MRTFEHMELENAKLERLFAERSLQVDMMREVNRENW
jgi:hypothetical protein